MSKLKNLNSMRKNEYNYAFHNKSLSIDINKFMLNIDGFQTQKLTPVYNNKIIEAVLNENVFMNIGGDVESYLNKPIYYSARNISNRTINDQEFYMDFLIYNDMDDIFPNGTVNRSLGHSNDVQEYEVHQVIEGSIMSTFKLPNGEVFFGVFSQGDYFEIPPGSFHCTYILEAPAIVVNYYCNTYWGSDITRKPYFVNKNEFTVEKHNFVEGKNFIIKEKGKEKGVSFTVDSFEEEDFELFKQFHALGGYGFQSKDYRSIANSIFDLFELLE